MEQEQLQEILSAFGLHFQKITSFFDTSHGKEDQRLNYILDDTYVLKVHSQRSIWEERLQQISRLIGRYRSIGIYCPRLIPTLKGPLSCAYALDGVMHTCFVEEYAIYPVCNEGVQLDRKEVVSHLGVLAANFTGVDLSDNYDMWSLFDLSPLDAPYGMDEKQSNAAMLTDALEQAGLSSLAEKVRVFNDTMRQEIRKSYRSLPRCVYQGDLNNSNYLHKDGHFAGLIDFNLSGTDVNINEFVNETNWFPTSEEFDSMTVPEILDSIPIRQAETMEVILANYRLNDAERHFMPFYRGICDLFQYPNVCMMMDWLKHPDRREKTVQLIEGLLRQTD